MVKRIAVSNKRLQINKNNATVVAVVAVAAFLSVFSLVASKALLSQRAYQSRVISQKKKTLAQLKTNNKAAAELVSAYKTFVSPSDNKIGGSSTGTGDKDGDNARIVLDALPSKYDFPALATSLEKIIASKNIKIIGITGIDDELNQSGKKDPEPKPVDMVFQVNMNSNFNSVRSISETFENSIRPIRVSKMAFTGSDDKLIVAIDGITYYQPEKTVTITTKVIK